MPRTLELKHILNSNSEKGHATSYIYFDAAEVQLITYLKLMLCMWPVPITLSYSIKNRLYGMTSYRYIQFDSLVWVSLMLTPIIIIWVEDQHTKYCVAGYTIVSRNKTQYRMSAHPTSLLQFPAKV